MTERPLPRDALQWFGVFGAPFAWTAQHVAGFALTLAACDRAGSTWDVPVDEATTVISIVAAVIGVAAGAAAIATFVRVRRAGEYDPPPPGRERFLAVVGMAITPLFVAMILMSGSGVLDLPGCRQS